MHGKKVSTIIPTFNSAKYIKNAIDSVLEQDHKDVEIIVIDDGSTDNTELELSDYIKRNVIIYVKQKNAGPAAARNKGIAHATGKYIAFLDADDIWTKDKLTKQLDFLLKHDLDLVYTSRFFIGFPDKKEWANNSIQNTKHLIEENFITMSSVMARIEIIKQNNFNEDKRLFAVEDYDLWLRLKFKHYKFGYLSEKLTGYRIHVNQISSIKNINNLIYLYRSNIANTNNYKYKFLLLYMYLKITLYKIRLKGQ